MEATPQETVLEIVREVLGRPHIGLDDDLFDHGGTSLSFVRVLAGIKEKLHVTVRAADLAGVATPRRLTARALAAQPTNR
ncbi:acyl carrier protein [Streptomyces sp. NPDC052109]|uniref:acyl carrier protein n=1 Tax=Streptomyces sp. NPDC052109 TaxID=3155527 RepID=UPI00341A0CBE